LERHPWLAVLFLAGLATLSLSGASPGPAASRRWFSLAGDWQFQTNGAPADQWKTVPVPSTFEEHEGLGFDGVGWYRRPLPKLTLRAGERVLLHFQAAATAAEVWIDQRRLGAHLGGWTPFRLDITEFIQASAVDASHELRVRLVEKVGHNTQGFLPMVQPHFGGLWQEVSLLVVPPTWVDDLELLAYGDPATGLLRIEFPLQGQDPPEPLALTVRHRLRGAARFARVTLGEDVLSNVARATLKRTAQRWLIEIPVPRPRLWSPADPALYEIELRLGRAGAPAGFDRVATRAAFRRIETHGHQLRLNDQPLNVRGLLNWGYYPPRLAPFPDEARWRRDLELARRRGFNLMKFCLWVPPRRFLELCDETGMLAWVEYPTWHPQLTADHLEPLRQEFREFFRHDRSHPSVILRSLTCETGPSADLEVIRSLYNLAHAMIPGAVIEDDSSWIGWNRVSDIYDDHPYGNNHTWVTTLTRLRQYIAEREAKPLVLGEAIAADTWVPAADRWAPDGLGSEVGDRGTGIGGQRPRIEGRGLQFRHWYPGAYNAQRQWQQNRQAVDGPEGVARLWPDSLHYAGLMRKYQAETFRREVPDGGYVVSVIRDIPTASMGLLDYFDQPKWSERDWAWHGDTMVLLRTPSDRRCFVSGSTLDAELALSHFGPARLVDATLTITLTAPEPAAALSSRGDPVASGVRQRVATSRVGRLTLLPGTLTTAGPLRLPLPEAAVPQRLELCARLRAGRASYTNHWPIWVVPVPQPPAPSTPRYHPSIGDTLARELFPGAAPWVEPAPPGAIVVAARFDEPLVRFLEQGGRVLLLPDGQPHSLPLAAHWFLRGAPYLPSHPLLRRVPRDLLLELQHFDLADRVIPDLPYLEQIEPILLLWDTHDLRAVKTHGVVFETAAGRGRLMVSALRHTGADNAAGPWLLEKLLEELASDRVPRARFTDAQWARLKERLQEEKLDLTQRTWRFRPDPDEVGLKEDWQGLGHNDGDGSGWSDIKVGQHWESQGWPALDRWAWYRLRAAVPETWKDRPVYLSFEGVDDLYELYVNSHLVARHGDLATRVDTFNERFSHDLRPYVKPGDINLIAVRVYDWYGAGGIFRPVTLGTTAFSTAGEIVR
jgi:hypothetical protein